jgi:hypothetical protein
LKRSFGLFDCRHDGFFHEVAREVLRRNVAGFGAIDVEAYARDILQETVTFCS